MATKAYKYLNNDVKEFALLSNVKPNEKTFVVWGNGGYVLYPSLEEFVDEYEKTPTETRFFQEVALEDTRRFYFDLECPVERIDGAALHKFIESYSSVVEKEACEPDDGEDEADFKWKTAQRTLLRVLVFRCQQLAKDRYEIKDDLRFVVCERRDDDKLSLHVVVTNLASHRHEIASFAKLLVADACELRPFVDLGVYDSNRCFRLPRTHKLMRTGVVAPRSFLHSWSPLRDFVLTRFSEDTLVVPVTELANAQRVKKEYVAPKTLTLPPLLASVGESTKGVLQQHTFTGGEYSIDAAGTHVVYRGHSNASYQCEFCERVHERDNCRMIVENKPLDGERDPTTYYMYCEKYKIECGSAGAELIAVVEQRVQKRDESTGKSSSAGPSSKGRKGKIVTYVIKHITEHPDCLAAQPQIGALRVLEWQEELQTAVSGEDALKVYLRVFLELRERVILAFKGLEQNVWVAEQFFSNADEDGVVYSLLLWQVKPYDAFVKTLRRLDEEGVFVELFKQLKFVFHASEEILDSTTNDVIIRATDRSGRRVNKLNIFVPPANTLDDVRALVAQMPADKLAADLEKIDYHFKQIICLGREKVQRWLFNWMLSLYLLPLTKSTQQKTAPIIWGAQSSGKTQFFVKCFAAYFGLAYSYSQCDDYSKPGYGHLLMGKSVVLHDEFRSKKADYDSWKKLISENVVQVRLLYENARQYPHYAKFIFLTNHQNPIRNFERDDRRFAIIRCSSKMKGNKAYWDALYSIDWPAFVYYFIKDVTPENIEQKMEEVRTYDYQSDLAHINAFHVKNALSPIELWAFQKALNALHGDGKRQQLLNRREEIDVAITENDEAVKAIEDKLAEMDDDADSDENEYRELSRKQRQLNAASRALRTERGVVDDELAQLGARSSSLPWGEEVEDIFELFLQDIRDTPSSMSQSLYRISEDQLRNRNSVDLLRDKMITELLQWDAKQGFLIDDTATKKLWAKDKNKKNRVHVLASLASFCKDVKEKYRMPVDVLLNAEFAKDGDLDESIE